MGRRCDASLGRGLQRHEIAFKVAAGQVAVRVCRVDNSLEYSRGAEGSLGAISRRKSSESSIGMTNEGKVNQHPESSAMREHPAPRRRCVQMENSGKLRRGTWYTLLSKAIAQER
jgi:hypothetical protein